jgi:hypothetical protein
VAAEFSSFFANKILTSEKVWNSILTDPVTHPYFHQLFTHQLSSFVSRFTPFWPKEKMISAVAATAISKLPGKVHVLHGYIDRTLNLQESLRVSMEGMTSAQFERVLHPIFEEDEFTLILAGAILGFIAGLVQQGIETGTIKMPNVKTASHALSRCSTFLTTSAEGLVKNVRNMKKASGADIDNEKGTGTSSSKKRSGVDEDPSSKSVKPKS